MGAIRSLIDYYRDGDYLKNLSKLMIPLVFQNLMFASLNMVGNVLVGQRGDVAVAAVGLAGQVFFLLNLLVFGITSGTAILIAQMWGKRDIANIRRVLGLCLMLALAGAVGFIVLSMTAPEKVLEFYSDDPRVIAAGAEYLQVMCWSFIGFSITFSYATALRSVGEVRMPVIVSISTLILNVILTYGLLLGRLGLPNLGIPGAALAIVISRTIEATILLVLIYRRGGPIAAPIAEMVRPSLGFVVAVFKPVLPVIITEILWAGGTTTYKMIYGKIGTESIAAINIMETVDLIALVPIYSLNGATSVLVGNSIGANDNEGAFQHALRSLRLAILTALILGAGILLLRDPIISLYKISPETQGFTHRMLLILALFFWMRVSNMIQIISALRSGGDTWFSLLLDGCTIWVVGVPLAWTAAFVWHLPIYWVYLIVMSEEFVKWAIGLWRLLSRKWIHNLAEAV